MAKIFLYAVFYPTAPWPKELGLTDVTVLTTSTTYPEWNNMPPRYPDRLAAVSLSEYPLKTARHKLMLQIRKYCLYELNMEARWRKEISETG